MFLGENLEIRLNNPGEEFTLGLHCQAGEAIEVDPKTFEPLYGATERVVYRFIFGFLIFNIIYYW